MFDDDLRTRWEDRAREVLRRNGLPSEDISPALDDVFAHLSNRAIAVWREERDVLWTAQVVAQLRQI